MSEWIHEGKPPLGMRAEVWMRNGSVRNVVVCDTMMGPLPFFTDCTHPLQNCACNPMQITAWRLPATHPKEDKNEDAQSRRN